ncbi:MAG: hypothetical protein ABIH84_02560 [bacterium]
MFKFLAKLLGLFTGKKVVSDRVLATVTRDWQEVETLLRGGAPSQLKQALIIADRALDSALKDLLAGQSMGDRLKNAKGLFHPQTYDKVWQAHKLRNALVHESGFEAQSFVLKASVANLQSALREIGVRV